MDYSGTLVFLVDFDNIAKRLGFFANLFLEERRPHPALASRRHNRCQHLSIFIYARRPGETLGQIAHSAGRN